MKKILAMLALQKLFSFIKSASEITETKVDDNAIEILELVGAITDKIKRGDYNVSAECLRIISIAKNLRRELEKK